MAKSKLLSSLREAYNIAHISIKSGIPTNEIIDTFAFKTTRRRFLYGGLAVASALSTASFNYRQEAIAKTTSKVLIVGGGIAGLTAGYRLQQAGVPVDIRVAWVDELERRIIWVQTFRRKWEENLLIAVLKIC